MGIQPFTLYLAAGELPEEELLKQAGQGVYIHSLGGLHAGANPVTGDFSLQSAGFLVEGGAIAHPVDGITVAGNLRDMFMAIEAVGSDVDPRSHIRTGSILVGGMTVAGVG